ncbi:MAG: HAMP domain-containing protein [Leptolyngbya sp. RL_3_1]|nr:HAMP domain-containing protein [Leptolyngbya sp. RL_3_1]
MKRSPPPLKAWFQTLKRKLRHPSLRTMFTVPVAVQLVTVVGLVGYLSLRNGEQAVQTLATQLRSELSIGIKRELDTYFGEPHAINRLNAIAFRFGDLDIENAQYGEHLLFQQMRLHPTIAFIYCGSARSGEFFGVLRMPETGELQFSYGNANNGFLRDYYSLDLRGQRQFFRDKSTQRFDSRTRPWYQAALDAEGLTWTDVYIAFTTGLPNITASLPVYDGNQDRRLLGVCATDVVLPEEFRTFLKQLEIGGKSGRAFVIDRQGQMISSSTDEPLTVVDNGKTTFLRAKNSTDPLVRASVQVLREDFGQLESIRQSQQLTFDLDGKRQFLEVLPFKDGFGLDWLIVVVVPEAEFMGQIYQNTQTTIVLCVVALAIALMVGVAATRWITAPIVQLNAAVKAIAKGNWQQTLDIDRTDEVGELASSVNHMSTQLQQAFSRVEAQKNAFARFFPTEYLNFFSKNSITEINLGDCVSKEMAVMFVDIRKFTGLAENMPPQELADFMNAYLQKISPEIRRHHGFVIKFIGDCIMAVFPENVEDALDASLAQFEKIREYNQELEQVGVEPIAIGMGLHVGQMMLGIIGEPTRLQGDVLSDTVNLAARLEGISKVYGAQLLMSESVMAQLTHPERYQPRFLDRVMVKGRVEPLNIYEILAADSETMRNLKLQTRDDFETGVRHYQARDWLGAKTYFKKVLAVNITDRAAQVYLERLEQFLTGGTPEQWDGVWAFTHKN